MIGNCERCRLPEIYARLESNRLGVITAQANVLASQSPTQAQPFETARDEFASKLKETQVEYADFVNNWRGFCNNCKYGA